mmetsp:Transcript_42175/g.78438  ORF Transcript_42175/g.78438 Transcript_42175/m.78438 type:complete len:101 (+) Transcript_42175:258-560(+)
MHSKAASYAKPGGRPSQEPFSASSGHRTSFSGGSSLPARKDLEAFAKVVSHELGRGPKPTSCCSSTKIGVSSGPNATRVRRIAVCDARKVEEKKAREFCF